MKLREYRNMRIGNYPVYDELGNIIDTDYLETDNFCENNCFFKHIIDIGSNTKMPCYFIVATYCEKTNQIVFSIRNYENNKKINAFVNIPALEFADILHIACENNCSLDQVDRFVEIKNKLLESLIFT